MKFKVVEGTETFKKLFDLFYEMDYCNDVALDLALSLGFEKFGTSMSGRAGGISCFKADVKPEGFKVVGQKWQNLYMPKASNKELWEKIESLPIVSYEKFNDAIGFERQFKGLTHHRSYGVERLEGLFLIDTGDADYTPKEDMIEILESEYNKLLNTKTN